MFGWILRNLFTILLIAIGAGQWLVAWWLTLPFSGWSPPIYVHLAIVAGMYAWNRYLIGSSGFGRRPAPPNPAIRFYFAVAFTCLFCLLFFGVTSTVAAVASTAESVLRAQDGNQSSTVGIFGPGFEALTRGGFVLIGFVFAYGYTFGQARVRVSEIDIPIRDLPSDLQALRIAQISDIHMGQNMEPAELTAYVERINALDADLICVTGDMVDSMRTDIEAFLPRFAALRARDGVICILGNHDHYAGAERVSEAIQRLTDFTLLRDQHHVIPVGNAHLHIIGLDDRGLDWARGLPHDPVLDELASHVPEDDTVLLLSHRPDIFQHAAELGIHLTLSGHTHGGQVALPWFGRSNLNASRFITPFDRGLFRRGASALYTNAGLGVTLQKIRLATPREISVFRLVSEATIETGRGTR